MLKLQSVSGMFSAANERKSKNSKYTRDSPTHTGLKTKEVYWLM